MRSDANPDEKMSGCKTAIGKVAGGYQSCPRPTEENETPAQLKGFQPKFSEELSRGAPDTRKTRKNAFFAPEALGTLNKALLSARLMPVPAPIP